MTPVTDLKESWVTNDFTIVFAVPLNPYIPIFSQFHQPVRIFWPGAKIDHLSIDNR